MNLSYISLRGERHPLCYNLLAVEEICDEFGSLDGMSEAINSNDQGKMISAVGKVLKALMDGGRAYCQEMDIELPRPIRNPSALIDVTDPETVKAVFTTITAGKETTVEATPKNAEATQDDQ